MNSLNLEISDQEFIIKLDRKAYSVSAIQRVLTRIQHDSITGLEYDEPWHDVRSRLDACSSDSFDHLSEK